MADEKNSTYAVKLDAEIKEELLNMLEGFKEGSDATAGDFIKTLLSVYKSNKVVGNSSSVDADLRELNSLTSRIYNIYGNLLERQKSSNNALQIDFSEQLAKKDKVIEDLKKKIEDLENTNKVIRDSYDEVKVERDDLAEKKHELQKLNDSISLNVDALKREVKELQDAKDDKEKLSKEIEELKQASIDKEKEHLKIIKEKDSLILSTEAERDSYKTSCSNLNKKIAKLNKNHDEELSVEKDKLANELTNKYMNKLKEERDSYNKVIRDLQDGFSKKLLAFPESDNKVDSITDEKQHTDEQENM